jgi:hypothetical protein
MLSVSISAMSTNSEHFLKPFLVNARIPEALLSHIPRDAVVVTSDLDAAAFIRHRQVTRFVHARANLVKFDYLLYRKNNFEYPALYLRSWSTKIYEDDTWILKRAAPRMRPSGTF